MKNRSWSTFLIGIFFLMASVEGFAQSITLTGNVKDATGEPIIGAAVMEKGTQNGTVTDLDGNFMLKTTKIGGVNSLYLSSA